MSHDLFVRLSKYRPTERITPLENFFTELVRYFLAQEPAACREFLEVVLGNEAENFRLQKVESQELTKSKNTNLTGLFLDLVLHSDKSELIIENKVDSELGKDQLLNYLNYASERADRRVVVVSRDHNEIVEQAPFKGHSQFVGDGEVLWWEIADRWSKGKAHSNQFLVDSVLRFMEANQMGPLEPYQMEDMATSRLWNSFIDKTGKIVDRLSKRIRQPDWAMGGKFKWEGVFPKRKVGLQVQNGLLWYIPYSPANATPVGSEFWYFVGFRFGNYGWFPPALEEGQPECVVSIDVWPPEPERVGKLMLDEAERLNSALTAPAFKIGYSENRGVSLFLRRQLKDFLDETDQPAAILDFLEKSHEKLWPVVPKIHEHYRPETGPGVSCLPPTHSPILPSS